MIFYRQICKASPGGAMGWNGVRIKERADELDKSIVELARLIGVSRQSIDAWIKGQVPRGEHLIKLCREMRTAPDYFFTPEKESLVTVPQHRTIRRRKVTDEMQAASQEMAEQYVNIFRAAPDSSILPVVRATRRNKNSAKLISARLRKLSGIADDQPMDLEHAFRMLSELGIYTVFRPFPEAISQKIYAFYSRICDQRVIFVNTDTNIIDLIFQLLHEAIHAVRDELPDKFNEDEEEDFCDFVANYIQFPDEYIENVAYSIKGCYRGVIINKLKELSRKHAHSLFGISKRLEQAGIALKVNVAGADVNLKKAMPNVSDILFDDGDARRYIERLHELSPNFTELVADQASNASLRKLGEWMGLDNTIDAKLVLSELQRIGKGS
jgi:transcriptional regulator with XRE-family HTH domain